MIPTLYIMRTPDGLDFPLPSYTSRYHMALNLQAGIATSLKINSGERIYIPVGFAIGVPDGFCGQIVSIPELAKEHGIIVLDSPSLLHPANREPIFVLLENTSPYQFILTRGDIVAQLLITPAVQIRWDDQSQDDILQGNTTQTTDILLDKATEEVEKSSFSSTRRQARSIREGFKIPHEDK